jgi:alpha-mannosidase
MKILLFLILMILIPGPVFSQKPDLKTENVIVVFKTHFDIGYTDLAGSVVNKYKTSMIEGALKVIEKTKSLPGDEHFTWTLPAWPMQQILSGSSPGVKEKIVEALQNKYLAVHALPFTIETEASDLETLARSFQSSSDISRAYSLELPTDAKMTDVPEHSWILATVLANAGVRFLHLGCNAASQSPEVPDLFWWEGPDGSRVLTMYSWKYYGTDVVPPEGWPYKTWLAIIHTNDNQGAPEPEVVQQTLDEIKRLNPNARVTQGRMSDFCDLLLKENSGIPVVRKDMPDTWIHGYMSKPAEVKISRTIKKEIFTLDMLNTGLNLWKSKNIDLSDEIKKAVENSLLFDEHTFGLAMSHGHSGYWCYGDQFKTLKAENVFDPIEFSWKEKSLRIIDAERVILPELNDKVRELANSVNIEEAHITVYNPLPWKRNGLVVLQTSSGNLKGATSLKDIASGRIIDITNSGNIIRFIAENVPAMGYKSYLLTRSNNSTGSGLRLKNAENVIENEFLKVTIDRTRGGVGSIIEKKSGREIVKPGSEYVFGGYVYERFSRENTESYAKDYIKGGWDWAPAEIGKPNLTDEKYKQVHPEPYAVEYEIDKIKVSAIMHFRSDDNNPYNYTMIYSLYKDLPYLEVQWGITGKSPEPWPEAGWISFPFNVVNPTFHAGRLGAIVDPSTDYIKNSNLDYCFVNTGIAITDPDRRGFGISSPDVPGISLDRPGLWKFTRNFTPVVPNVFYNLYNNQWSTNFTEWIEGSWSARFYIWPVDDYGNEKSVITPSEELRVPMLAEFSAGGRGQMASSSKGIELSMRGVLVTAFGKNPDGKGLILRLWEQAGNSGKCTVSLPEGLEGKTATPVNLRGEATGVPIEIRNNSISVDIKSYKPYSFVISDL